MTLPIVSVGLFRIMSINEVIRGMFRMSHQIVSGKLGQSFLEAGLHSATLLLLVRVLNMITVFVFTMTSERLEMKTHIYTACSHARSKNSAPKKSAVINL